MKQVAVEALPERLQRHLSRLSGRRRELLRSILADLRETFYLSSRALARRYGVDPATVIRSVQALGYDRFADFADDLRRHFVSTVTPCTILRASVRRKRDPAHHLRRSLELDHDNLRELIERTDAAKVIAIARRIIAARRVLVVGVDLAHALSSFLAYGLTLLGLDADAPVGSSGNLLHRVRLLNSKDLLIAISFGRCLRETVEAALRARRRGVPTLAVTDSDGSPLARNCDEFLLASIRGTAITGSYAAPMSLINALLVACAHLRLKRPLKVLRETEREDRSGSRGYDAP